MPTPLSNNLTPAQRRRGVLALMVSTFFSWAGFFLLIPLVAIHYVDDIHWAAGFVGVMLAVRQFTQQGFAPLFGIICDRTGPKLLICAGQVLRAVGFGAMAYVESPATVLLAMFLAGIGGAMFDAPKSSAMAVLTSPEDRQRRYATLGVIGGMGVTLGTQAGAFLIKRDFGNVALVSAAVYLCLAIWNMLVLPTLSVSIAPIAAREGLDRIWRDRPFIRFVMIGIGYYFVMSQFSLAFTLAAADIAGSRSAVVWIYLVNTGITIALGYLVPRWLERWGTSIDLVAWGTFIAGAGLCIVAFSAHVGLVLIAAGVFSLGSIISRPGMDIVVANLAEPSARGAYFGVAQLSLAIGGAAGYLVGGTAYDFGIAHDVARLPWIGFVMVATVTAAAYWMHRTSLSQVRKEPLSESPITLAGTIPAAESAS